MKEAEENLKSEPEAEKSWIKTRLIPILGLIFIIAIAFGIFCFYRDNPERFEQLEELGYLGVFLSSLILNATVVLPAGNFVFLFVLGGTLPSPVLVGLIGGLAAAIGEFTGYAAGYSGQAIIEKRRLYIRLEGWMKRWGSLTVFSLSVAPLFFDIAGITAGALRFPAWKFFIACWLGRTILYLAIAWAGAMGLEWVRDFIG
jgi:membrane protein YqaA with SNARE-associated domain